MGPMKQSDDPAIHHHKPPRSGEALNIILTGFMGVGKSAVGRRLADALGWKLLDTDELIESRAGKAISRIFAEEGEAAFRLMEAEVARELIGLDRQVIATGGGMIVAQTNLRALEAAGAVVQLEASPETIWERVRQATHRPLLDKPDPQGEIQRLLAARAEAYGRVRIKIQTDGKTPEQIVEEIRLRTADVGKAEITQTVRVELGERSYPIEIGRGWIGRLGQHLAPLLPPPGPCLVVTNNEIGPLWGRAVLESLRREGYEVSLILLPEGENHKTMATVGLIHDQALAERHTRQGTVIALGGGVVGDMAGFAAATLLRGVSFIQIPTSLLAMVDSSVGGKTGVNHPLGKNLIGAFWQPVLVGIDLLFLDTLPNDELCSGLAEVIKTAAVADPKLFTYLEENIERALGRDDEVLSHLIGRCCRIKAEVVAEDERESGRRAILNFGHTFGHAAEALAGYKTVRHGEAVAMGMVAATRLAQRRGWMPPPEAQRIESLLERAGLPTRMLPYKPEDYWQAMASDKKVLGGKIRFILPEGLGKARLTDDVTREEVFQALEPS
jgi:shikimate kinase/3-dehydroquinate synthase